MDVESKLSDPNESIPSLNSNAEDEVENDVAEEELDSGDDLNSSIEALDWEDIDAELAECGVYAKTMESLKSSFTVSTTTSSTSSQIEIPAGAPVETPTMDGSSIEIPAQSTEGVPDGQEPVKTQVVEDEKPESEYGSGDVTSNAPVLDDGPIWSKGSKNYKAVENRRMNHLLTIGVILSLVMAIGIGLGNLAAVNECEEELKFASRPSACSCNGKSPFPDHGRNREQIVRTASSFATDPDIFIPKPKNPFKMDNSETGEDEILPFMPPRGLEFPTLQERAKWSENDWEKVKNRVSQLSSPAQELSKIVQVLDSLAVQLGKYENISRSDSDTDNIASRRYADEYFRRNQRLQVLNEPTTEQKSEIIEKTNRIPDIIDQDQKAIDPVDSSDAEDTQILSELYSDFDSDPVDSPKDIKELLDDMDAKLDRIYAERIASLQVHDDFDSSDPDNSEMEPEAAEDAKPDESENYNQIFAELDAEWELIQANINAKPPKTEEPEVASQKRYKFKKNKNAEDNVHKKREQRSKDLDSNSKTEKFQKNMKRHKRDRDRKTNTFPDNSKNQLNSVEQKNLKYRKSETAAIDIDENKVNIQHDTRKSNKYCKKDDTNNNNCKQQQKFKVKKVHTKHENNKNFRTDAEWDSVRSKARKEARKREQEYKKKTMQSWYFDRVKGREKFRH